MASSMLAKTALALVRARAPLVAARALSTNAVNSNLAAAASPALLMMLNPAAVIDPFVRSPIVFEIPSSLPIVTTQTPALAPSMVECPCAGEGVNEPLQAVKRTYQPSVLRRKRKHGFRTRVVSIGGRKVIKRRFLKGRWRMSL